MDKPRIAAIVPAHNEEATITSVVEVLLSSTYLDEILVISDGSTDRTTTYARAAGARVHQILRQGGKGEALLQALTLTDAAIVAFFDADLRGLTHAHIEQLVLPVIDGSRSMNIALRDRGSFVTALTRHLPLIAGERALRRELMEQISPRFLRGFMVEVALNYCCRVKGLPYGTVKLTGLTIRRKYEKVGWPRAVLQYGKMFFQVAQALVIVRVAHFLGKF